MIHLAPTENTKKQLTAFDRGLPSSMKRVLSPGNRHPPPWASDRPPPVQEHRWYPQVSAPPKATERGRDHRSFPATAAQRESYACTSAAAQCAHLRK